MSSSTEIITPGEYYLAHPFDSRKYVREWELKFEANHPTFTLLNPFYDRGGIGGRPDVEQYDKGGKPVHYDGYEDELVRRDLESQMKCIGTVAIIDGATSYGTIMEILYQTINRKPRYLIVTNGKDDHPWLRVHSTKIFTSFEDFEQEVKSSEIEKIVKRFGLR